MGGNRAMDPNDFVCFLRLQRSIVSKIAISQNQTFHHFCKTPFYLFAFLLVAFINDFKYRGGNVLEFHHLTGKRSSKFCARDFYNAAAGQRAIGCPGLDTPFGTVENPNWPHRFLLKYLSKMTIILQQSWGKFLLYLIFHYNSHQKPRKGFKPCFPDTIVYSDICLSSASIRGALVLSVWAQVIEQHVRG